MQQHGRDVGKCGCCTEGVCGSGRTTPLIPNLCTRRRLGDPKTQTSHQPARSAVARYKGCVQERCAHLRFWYHVLTCVSVRLSLAASSILSCTLRYFCRSKLFSKVCNWWSVNAVRAFRCFLVRFPLGWPPLPPPAASSSLWPVT